MDAMEAKDQYLKPEDVANVLGVSRETVLRECRDGGIPAVKIRGQWRVRGDYADHLPSPFREVA